ncbi:MAG: NADH-quinone oxidoreductase subunit L [Anaerolineales bacterium]|nr:NADH-quinone oxidoreductase subunit L [Anaerolineales bacterium]
MTNLLIWLLPVPPLLAFFIIVLFANRSNKASWMIGVGAAALSFLGSMVVFFQAVGAEHLGEHPFGSRLDWLPLNGAHFQIGLMVDPLSAIAIFFVAITVFMIFIYSVGYHNWGQPKGDDDIPGLPPHGATVVEHGHEHVVPSIEPMFARFFAFIGLFAFGMFTLVLADNLLLLFIGWEIMGLCSYLLIGFWYGKPSARAAMIKAFITTRVGDVFMLLGIALLYTSTGTLSFRAILFDEQVLQALASTDSGFFGLSVAGLTGILLFIGTIGKSAQFPLHVWLPDAMEGPTPVSAMIHAAAMVSAGVYMVIRMFPLMAAGMEHGHLTPPMYAMALIGSVTALFAATIALAQNDVKRVLAYSTISQLGYMVAALGIGAYVAATFHLVTHAFFKALLFLGSGSVIHGMEHGVLHTGDHHVDPQNMYNMGGLKDKMPRTFWTFLIGGFALSGFPVVTAGFWSKDEILADAWAHSQFVFWVLAIAAFLTAFYTMRQITLTFLGKPRTKEAEHAHETNLWMTGPLMVLAVLAIGFGWVGIPESFPGLGNYSNNWLHHFLGHGLPEWLYTEALEFSWFPLIASLVVALGGLGLGYAVYKDVPSAEEDPLKKVLGGFHTWLENKYYFDEAYDFLFIQPAKWFSEKVVFQLMDRKLIDGFLHLVARVTYWLGGIFRNYFDIPVVNRLIGDTLGGAVPQWFGKQLRKVQTGAIQTYMILAMVVAFGGLFVFMITMR